MAKFFLYLGSLGATGLVIVRIAFADLLAPSDFKLGTQALALATVILATSVLSFVLRGAILTGDIKGITDPEILSLLWETPVGDALILRLVGGGLLIAGLCVASMGKWVALLGGVFVLWSFVTIGHVTNLEPSGLRILLLMHLLGLAFWIGILSPLHYLTGMPDSMDIAALLGHRFGKAATIIVPALMLAGLLIGWMLIKHPMDLLTTWYGLVLLLKIALVGAVLGLAAANKLRIVPAMQRGDQKAARDLRRSLQLEAAIFLLILAVTATLTSVLNLPT